MCHICTVRCDTLHCLSAVQWIIHRLLSRSLSLECLPYPPLHLSVQQRIYFPTQSHFRPASDWLSVKLLVSERECQEALQCDSGSSAEQHRNGRNSFTARDRSGSLEGMCNLNVSGHKTSQISTHICTLCAKHGSVAISQTCSQIFSHLPDRSLTINRHTGTKL